jgi:hypothetical protein
MLPPKCPTDKSYSPKWTGGCGRGRRSQSDSGSSASAPRKRLQADSFYPSVLAIIPFRLYSRIFGLAIHKFRPLPT